MPAGGGYVAQSSGANGGPSDAHLYEWNVKQMWPMRATAEVRWFSAAYLVPHFAGGLERRILPPCMRSPSGAVYFVTCGGYSLVFI